MVRYRVFIVLVTIVVSVSCKKESLDYDAYQKYVFSEKSGLRKNLESNGYSLVMQMYPVDCLAMLDYRNDTLLDFDSLSTLYSGSSHFTLHLKPQQSLGRTNRSINDIEANDLDDYTYKYEQLHFGLEEYIRMNVSNKSLKPVLVSVEETFGLSSERKINIVFDVNVLDLEKDYHIQFMDPVFSTGINNFYYNKEDLEDLPSLNF